MKPVRPALLAFLLALATLPAAAQRVVDFVQFDGSSESVSVVAVRALGDTRAAAPAPLLSAVYARWSDGQAGGFGAVYRWALPAGAHAVSVGAGAGVNGWRSRAEGEQDSETALSLRLQAEAYGPAPGGHYYLLAQGSSFRDSWFATAQFDPAAWPLAFELSRYGERSYHATTLIARIAIGAAGWSLRAGAVRDDSGQRAVVGVGWNGF